MVRIALIQMVSSRQVKESLQMAERLVAEAIRSSPAAIFLPENFAALASHDPRQVAAGSGSATGEIQQFLQTVARSHGCYVFGGTIPLGSRPDGSPVAAPRVRAASLVFDSTGQQVARYDKIHMFDVDVADNQRRYRESDLFEPGTEPVWVDTPFARVGLSVCYDLRFPELYRKLFAERVDMIAVPSAFTEITGAAHFELLMRARAVENTCFMVAACQGGEHDSGRRTYGHSMAVSPWGEVLGQLARGEGVLIVDLDLDQLQQIRRNMPLHTQRRLH